MSLHVGKRTGWLDSDDNDKSVFLFNPIFMPDSRLSVLLTLLLTLLYPEWEILFPFYR